jgi:valyl-tRNA synthetase
MFFHGMLRDLQGRKFSKSLGNGIDPNKQRELWGTDAVRMALYTYSAPGRDGRASFETMSERSKGFRNFGTKLINIARFIIDLKPQDLSDTRFDIQKITHKEDREILKKLNALQKGVSRDIERFNLHLAVDKLYQFIWHEFADKYIEQSKKRRREAQPVLEYVLKKCLILLHPFMPYITEELYQKTTGHKSSILKESWS